MSKVLEEKITFELHSQLSRNTLIINTILSDPVIYAELQQATITDNYLLSCNPHQVSRARRI